MGARGVRVLLDLGERAGRQSFFCCFLSTHRGRRFVGRRGVRSPFVLETCGGASCARGVFQRGGGDLACRARGKLILDECRFLFATAYARLRRAFFSQGRISEVYT